MEFAAISTYWNNWHNRAVGAFKIEHHPMTSPLRATAILEREYLAMRAKVLELAASFDRIQRSDGGGQTDVRWKKLEQGVRILLEEEDGRAERVQLHFSREYSEDWREAFGIAGKN